MKKGRLKQGLALLLATVTMSMSVIPHLPPDLLTSYAFNINFTSSGQAGHPDISGDVGDGYGIRGLFCLNKGASAHSNYDYQKIDADVNYATGSLEEKRLFWAYIATYGSADNDVSIQKKLFNNKIPLQGNTRIGKEVAWSKGASNGGSELIERLANDGFASLDKLPPGCKSPQDILNTVMSYNTPQTAISINSLLSGPGQIDTEKLYSLAGINDIATFNKYCTVTAEPISYNGETFYVKIEQTDKTISYRIVDANGYMRAGLKLPPATLKVSYDPAVFKVRSVTGKLEYFKSNVAGSQQLYRAMGRYLETSPEFYITTGEGGSTPTTQPSGGGGGSLEEGKGIEVKIYEHKESFESNYRVELTKKDYETGGALENSLWQVLEAFPDRTKLAADEAEGKLVEKNMREAPTSWEDWLIFDEDLKTDENGHIAHADRRYYDFDHTYCDGHPMPEAPESDDEEAQEEYEALMEEWQAAVDECAARAAASGGRHHHWVSGQTEPVSEQEAFERSGARAARDAAYENFINLRYSYTFRETDARDGYIIHAKNGHPDDVPVEVITTASSEAQRPAEWTKADNEELYVTGRARDYTHSHKETDEENNSADAEPAPAGRRVRRSLATASESRNLYLTEKYDLSLAQKAVNALRQFVGLPKAYADEDEFVMKIVAAYDEAAEATASDATASEPELATDSDAEREVVSGYHYDLGSNATSDRGRPRRTRSVDEEASEASAASGGYISLENAILDSQAAVTPKKADSILHSWVVYDHRVPGQIHINKRDMALAAGEGDNYSAYGDTQGDATLEGAVYGLFAADAIYHPDTQRNDDGSVKKGSGIVFDANDLVAVATTDKNGDASFLAITERPHSIYNYQTGQIEYTGKAYPKNLYEMSGYRKSDDNEETGRIYENLLETNGDYWIGRPLILGNYYIKELTRSEGFELSITGKDMALSNASAENRAHYGATEDALSHPQGSAWIDEKLSFGTTFPEANETYGGRENILEVGVKSNDATRGYDVVFDGLPQTDDIAFYFNKVQIGKVNIQVPVGGEWVDAQDAPLYETAADNSIVKRDREGNPIKNPDAVADFPLSYVGYGYQAKKLSGTSAEPAEPDSYARPFTGSESNFRYVKYELESMLRALGAETPKDAENGRYSEPDFPVYDMRIPDGFGMPEQQIQIENVTSNKSLIDALLGYFVEHKVYTYGSLQRLERSGSTVTATLAVGMNPKKTALYETDEDGRITAGYLFRLNKTTGRYVMRRYSGEALSAEFFGSSDRVKLILRPDFTVNEESGLPENKLTYRPGTEYLSYQTGETIYDYFEQDASGNWVGHEPKRRKVYRTLYETREAEQQDSETSRVPLVAFRESVADPVGSSYVYYDAALKQYVLHAGADDAGLSGSKAASFTVALPNGSVQITEADIEKIGENNVWGYRAGERLKLSEYLVRIQGAGAGVHSSADFEKNSSFIKNQRLVYRGNFDLAEDGNTGGQPNWVEERIIGQSIKITKTIDDASYNVANGFPDEHESWFESLLGRLFGQQGKPRKVNNFRFKSYLRSNLERLYRDDDGAVVWQDRKGNTVDQLALNEQFPALVNKIYTKVLHRTEPLFKNSEEAVSANDRLYDYTDGLINESQNEGYTAILERLKNKDKALTDLHADREHGNHGDDISADIQYNYDKFFDALAVANNDKWDKQAQSYSSWRPIGNASNRSELSIENAKASDKVRQFAIDWYLDDEVKKLVKASAGNSSETEDKEGGVTYAGAVYDKALAAAIVKAENYLKPFFAYDLDRIYAIEWDSEAGGGRDGDRTTLSADTLQGDNDNTSAGYYYASSAMLPYGVYVVAEQQPEDTAQDYKNRHYRIDRPKELVLPSAYESYEGSQQDTEPLNPYYNYDSGMSQAEMERKYKIRFNEEAAHVIKGRNAQGDFEVYKYGLSLKNIRNGVTGTGQADYFALTQAEYKPYKNYYNAQDDRTTGEVPYYLSEGMSGREAVSKYYRYSAVSEAKSENQTSMKGVLTAHHGRFASMLIPWTIVPSANAETEKMDTALSENGESSYKGFDYLKFKNRFFAARLRIEKLDAQTHENILHDGALFMIYKAQRDEKNNTIKFYETDTRISGSEEFLKAMNAEDIQELTGLNPFSARKLYSGIVKAGTPVCDETDKVSMPDALGNEVGAFEAFSTINDISMRQEDTDSAPNEYRSQATGYLETPQPLSAGSYVLLEIPPSGYVRTKPIAIELYSDKVTYYKEGKRDKRVLAALYNNTEVSENLNGETEKDKEAVAQIYVENTPIKLQVEKVKRNGTVSFKLGSRVEGSLTEIGGNPRLEYAYADGQYLGYAYAKGTLERLSALKDAGEEIELVYEGGQFAGYGYMSKALQTNDDANPYVTGAKLTLFDAIELTPSGDREDYAYEGVQIERNQTGNITRMFVKKGYAGKKTELIKEKDADGNEVLSDYVVGFDRQGKEITKKGYTWKEGVVERPDTDILYYDLDSLSVTWKERINGRELLFGWDKHHQKVSLAQLEADKKNHAKTDREHAVYAFKGGQAVLEFVGGDFTKLSYDKSNKLLSGDFARLERVNDGLYRMGKGTVVYHLDEKGNRDAMVEPHTGMAFVLEAVTDKSGARIGDRILVWPLRVAKDASGNIIARDKITTSRIATIGENEDGYHEKAVLEPTNHNLPGSESSAGGQIISDEEKPGYQHDESGRINGSWQSENGEESHQERTQRLNPQKQNMNEEVLTGVNNGSFLQYMNPVYDEHGLVLYYQRSSEQYDKGSNLYDRNGDFVRYRHSDKLEAYNRAAYALDEDAVLHDGQADREIQTQDRLYHRKGESYILENTWLSSDKTPNDPFASEEMEGQPDLIKRLPAGKYILEELATPQGKGYVKTIPMAITVKESKDVKRITAVDDTSRVLIEKLDAPGKDRYSVLDMSRSDKAGSYVKVGEAQAYGLDFSYAQISGARLALYPASYHADLTKPQGYRLDKNSDKPFVFETSNSTAKENESLTALWTSGSAPIYLEGIPEGYYILEELSAPRMQGFVKAAPVYVHVGADSELQSVVMADEHTKLAFEKYRLKNGQKSSLAGAHFGLYEALLDEDGRVMMKDGEPQYDKRRRIDSWVSDDATDYTESIRLRDYPNTAGSNEVSGFVNEFEKMYEAYGVNGRTFSWSVERRASRENESSAVWLLEDGSRVATEDNTVSFPPEMSKEDREGFKAAYAAMRGNKLTLKWAASRTAQVVSVDKIDAEKAGGKAQKYPAVALVKLNVLETGKIILVKAVYNGKEFTYSYKFNYEKLGINEYANAWLSADGMHRIDYLPAGKKLVLVEEEAPSGYAQARPRMIEVAETADIQLHGVVNEQNALLISKKSLGSGKEFAGNKLALYRADESGNLTQSEPYLVEEWTSGTDGTYTESDRINGLIPAGFKQGDLRAHSIYRLSDGKYFLLERQAKDYYRAFEPIELHYTSGQKQQLVEALNRPVEGKLTVTKKDEAGAKLQGVVFELSAFDKHGKAVEGFPRQLSDTNGVVTASKLPVGSVQPDGSIAAYTYRLKELTPPAGYAASAQVYSFKFDDGKESYTKDASIAYALHELEVKNAKTRFYLEKKDFDKLNDTGLDGAFIDGAKLAIYRVRELSSDGAFSYEASDLVETWTSSGKEGRHLLEGLVAGQSYVFVETQAPSGYNLMKPVLFTVSADGRSISEVSNRLSVIEIERGTENQDTDSIAALTVKGRSVKNTEVAVLDESGKEVLRFVATGGEHVISDRTVLKDNAVYTFVEHTLYSDGSDVVTARLTRRVHFGAQGFVYQTRLASALQLQITDEAGSVLAEFMPKAGSTEQRIENPLRPENPLIELRNTKAQAGNALEASQAVMNRITYYNPTPRAATVLVEAEIAEGASVIEAYQGSLNGDTVRWRIEEVAPYTQGSVSFASEIKEGAASVLVNASVKVEQQSFSAQKRVPIRQPGALTIYNELTGSGRELHREEISRFNVRLWDAQGNELPGSYAFSGSRSGRIRSGDVIELSGNEFISIVPTGFKNCTYEVTREEDGKNIAEKNTKGAMEENGSSAYFTRSVGDGSERQRFVRGGKYLLTERSYYTDGEVRISNRFSFSLDETVRLTAIGAYDRISRVTLSKTDFTTGKELPGNHMQLTDKNGKVVEEWLSTDKPHELSGLTPGERYTLKELSPVSGYAYAEEITFRVNEDGTAERVVMEDKPTRVHVSKKDITNGEELPGAVLEIFDRNGKSVERWVSANKPYELVGKLVAGERYTLRETISPDGFAIANEISFTVSRDGRIDYVTMIDDTTKVRIYKNEFGTRATPSEPDKGKAVSGSRLQILNEDKTPFMYNAEPLIFTSQESFTLLEKILTAKKSYYLHELEPAVGYAYADDVHFTVSTDGSVDVVVMEDKQTEVRLSKTDITGERELPGNHMQLLDQNGTVLEQWVSADKPHVIRGKLKAGETYILSELSPAPGYAYAADVRFTVNRDGSVNLVEMRNDITKVEILKVSSDTGLALAGAEFELLDKDGRLVERWISGREAHQLYGRLIAGERYVLRETKAPSGYLKLADIPVTVNLNAKPLRVVVKNRKLPGGGGGGESHKLRIRKVDEAGKPLAGAAFKVVGEDGRVLSVTKESGGTVFVIQPDKPQRLRITELGAPKGYTALENEYVLEFGKDGKAVLLNADESFYQDGSNSYVIYAVNQKTPPQTPPKETPDNKPKKGRITASFDRKLHGLGRYSLHYQGSVIDLSAKTGDTFPLGTVLSVFVGSLLAALGAAFVYWRRKKGKSSDDQPPKGGSSPLKRAVLVIGLVAAAMLAARPIMAFAASSSEEKDATYKEKIYISDTDKPEAQNPGFEPSIMVDGDYYVLDSVSYEVQSKKRIEEPEANLKVITSEPFVDDESKHMPDKIIKEGDETYYLKSYEIVETKLDARTEPVTDTITYSKIPVDSNIPEMAKISVKDAVAEKDIEVQVPIVKKEFSEPHWIAGFEFPITVFNYDANVFDLNGNDVPLSEQEPLKGYESELLNMIGVSAENYRIQSIAWDGGTYTEDGIVCRKLMAVGEMRVTDCKATYSGIVNLPEVAAKAVQAVYSDRPTATAAEAESNIRYTMKATAKYVRNEEELIPKKSIFEQFWELITNPVVIAVMLVLLFVVLVIWLIHRRKRNDKREKILFSPQNKLKKK